MAYQVKAIICNSSGQVFETIPISIPAGVVVTSGNVNVINTPNVSVTNTPTVDTELPAASALGDLLSNPTAPAVGAHLEILHGPTWNAPRTVGAASGTTSGSVILGVGPLGLDRGTGRYFPIALADPSGTVQVSDVHSVSSWAASGAADNATATATKAADAGKSLYVDLILASFSGTGAVTAKLTLRDGATEVASHYVRDSDAIRLNGYRITAGNSFSAELAAGGSGVIGNVVVLGHSY